MEIHTDHNCKDGPSLKKTLYYRDEIVQIFALHCSAHHSFERTCLEAIYNNSAPLINEADINESQAAQIFYPILWKGVWNE